MILEGPIISVKGISVVAISVCVVVAVFVLAVVANYGTSGVRSGSVESSPIVLSVIN